MKQQLDAAYAAYESAQVKALASLKENQDNITEHHRAAVADWFDAFISDIVAQFDADIAERKVKNTAIVQTLTSSKSELLKRLESGFKDDETK